MLIYLSALFLLFSVLGYGFLLSRIIGSSLISFNIGYQGLLGILLLTTISYFTIFFVKHGYLHNLIIHFIGILSFIFYVKKNNFLKQFIKITFIFTILFVALLIIRNHDDFNYYHLTYSLGLTENKIFLGLGQFQHGYKHHSSIFFFNSIIFLPFIKYYLFHSLGWFTLVFVNYIILDVLIFKNKKILDFEYYFYLLIILFINVKFSRIGGYGTDLSAQIILLTIFPLIYSTLQSAIKVPSFKSNFLLIILLITYTVTLKAFFILNFLFLIPFLFFYDYNKIITLSIFNKAIIFSFITIILLIMINFSYTGCAIYPVKETCLSGHLTWALEKEHVERMSDWYHQWSKAGAGINFRVEDPEKYIQNFNWLSNWYERYFLYKFKEFIIGIVTLLTLFFVLFRAPISHKRDRRKEKTLFSLTVIALILAFEWFYNHPALRYGGYHLFCILAFIPISFYLSQKKIYFLDKKKTIFSLILISIFIFYYRNIDRIAEEHQIVKENNFPLFYVPQQQFRTVELNYKTKLYIPTDNKGCWVIKTPCVNTYDHIVVNKKFGFTIFSKKNSY